ncbi:cation diffusion facilitator family transporter [Nocardioides sp. SOB77]|uniref:Cation diffusion facilitator family transporter n=1 Tax=Nocardioides oceani TaxID=3058369 RepID=A0ABT8FLQ4_9ACTN|nr:cation diffusion facilitator family transporter [Nocardioides oceani]MDN4175608.1 cation diffusion facilitator family transporter [Nocardioides oceani]
MSPDTSDSHDHPSPTPSQAPHEDHDDHDGHDGHDIDHGHAHGAHDHEHATGIKGFLSSLFRPHSHDAADSIDSALESSAEGIRALKISLVILGLTALAQLVVVLFTGSVALLADTIHNFSDALTAVPLWIAFVMVRRAPTRRYTYGYGRAEDLAGVFIVAMIALSAAVAGYESVRRLLDPQPISNVGVVLAAGVLGFVGNEAVALYRIRVGRKIGSAALVADGLHARTDGFTSLAVAGGAIGVMAGFPLADPIVGLLITVAILVVLKSAARDIYRRLMDAVEPELVDTAEAALRTVPGVQDVESLRLRWLGHRLRAETDITVENTLSVAAGHAIAVAAEHELLHAVPRLDAATVHVNPSHGEGADPHEVMAHHQ